MSTPACLRSDMLLHTCIAVSSTRACAHLCTCTRVCARTSSHRPVCIRAESRTEEGGRAGRRWVGWQAKARGGGRGGVQHQTRCSSTHACVHFCAHVCEDVHECVRIHRRAFIPWSVIGWQAEGVLYLRACVRVSVRASVHASQRACVRACVRNTCSHTCACAPCQTLLWQQRGLGR